VKSSLIQVLENTPANGTVFIGLITFYKHINVYELASKINTVFCINGTKEYNLIDFMNILGVNVKGDPQGKSYDIFKRFIIQINNKADIQKIIRRVRDIRKDQSITVN
jgi:GTP:adenosylcobinamide-phosphate guanylyltransferase